MKKLCVRISKTISICDIKELLTNHPIELVRYMYIVSKVCEGEEKIILCPKRRLYIGYCSILPEVEIKLEEMNNMKNLNVRYYFSNFEKIKLLLLIVCLLAFQIVLLFFNVQNLFMILSAFTCIISFFALVFILDIFLSTKRINKYIKDILINEYTQ